MKKITSLSIVLLAAAFSAQAQTISTYAGNGSFGATGDGGNATAAEFANNDGIAVDALGNVYVADNQNNAIRMISTSGVITTVVNKNKTPGFAGDGAAATAAELTAPTAVAFDKKGNMYIADQGNERVRMVNTSGTISTIAGNGTAGSTGDGAAATAAELHWPSGVCIDAAGNVYIADQINNKIRIVNSSGTINTFAGTGTSGATGDGAAATAAELGGPWDVNIDAAGNIYISDQYNNKIRIVNTSGTINTFAGTGTSGYTGDGGAATAAELWYPWGVTFDTKGNVYIDDYFNSVVRMVNSSGKISTYAGDGTQGFKGDGGAATAAELSTPAGVAMDAGGNLYISDLGNLRIRKVSAPTSVNEILNVADVKVYPNPSTGIFTVEVKGMNLNTQCNIEVYNMLGQQVYTSLMPAINSRFIVNMSAQPAGIYLLKLQAEDGSQLVQRIEVTR